MSEDVILWFHLSILMSHDHLQIPSCATLDLKRINVALTYMQGNEDTTN